MSDLKQMKTLTVNKDTVNQEVYNDCFTIDWTALPSTGNAYLTRWYGSDKQYVLKARKDANGCPVFETVGCTIMRVIGYY